MARRTKEELEASGYYDWLKERERLQEKKKKGEKLTSTEKETLRTVPTPENPFKGNSVEKVETTQPKPQRPKDMKKIEFGVEKVFEVKAGYFLCEVRNLPYQDTECMLLCERSDCPFHLKGYFRSKGEKF